MKSYRVGACAGELDWSSAEVLSELTFPWEATPPPRTEFRALSRAGRLHFRFDCEDRDLVLADGSSAKQCVLGSDRVELFFATSLALDPYFCLEIDPRGNVYQYRARSYRNFEDTVWAPELELETRIAAPSYWVEGSLPLETLRSVGVLATSSREIIAGVYRAEFSRRDGHVHFGWISWVNPLTTKPDFHVCSSFGKLVLPD
jgi:Carbohydrate family 9 binding domain-like